MVSKEMITELILKMDTFMSKKGTDIPAKQALMDAINTITGNDDLDMIYVNTVDNIQIPDVAVLPLYQKNFSRWIMDPENANTCPYGYTLEISSRCFDKFTAEELTSVIIHDILQNMYSDTAKVRFMKAWTAVISKHRPEKILSLFDDISLSEITFMTYMEICMRPFRVPILDYDYVATDEVLKAYGLADAYESYLEKVLPRSIDTPDAVINREIANDYRDVNTIIDACLDKDIRHYYDVIKNAIPLITFGYLLGDRKNMDSLGFTPRYRSARRAMRMESDEGVARPLTESYNDPRTDLDIRFQVDKIISSMRYAESEAEREAILFNIKQLSMKVYKILDKLNREATKNPNNKAVLDRIEYMKNILDELEALRQRTVNMEVKTKRWSIYIKDSLPTGYDF